MGDPKDLQSPLRRAKFGVMTWIDLLPDDPKMEAMMALEKLCDVAERQIEQAYFDGNNNHQAVVRARPFRPQP